MADLTIIIIGISVVLLSVALKTINDKVDKHIRKFRKFEEALKKNATGRINNTAAQQAPRQYVNK
jgi:uncharacterized protein YoxC